MPSMITNTGVNGTATGSQDDSGFPDLIATLTRYGTFGGSQVPAGLEDEGFGTSTSAADAFQKYGVITAAEDTQAKITFQGDNGDYRNALLMYRLDQDGTVTGAEVVFANASARGSGGELRVGESSVTVDLKAGDRVAFALLPDGFSNEATRDLLMAEGGRYELRNGEGDAANILTDDPADIRLVHVGQDGTATDLQGRYGTNLFHTAARTGDHRPNADGSDHADQVLDVQDGTITVGMEDLKNLGDNDRDDVRFSIEIGTENARALAGLDGTGGSADAPRSFRDMAGMDGKLDLAELKGALEYFAGGNGILSGREINRLASLLNVDRRDLKDLVKDADDLGEVAEALMEAGDKDQNGSLDAREVLGLRAALGGVTEAADTFREMAGLDWKASQDEIMGAARSFDKNGDGKLSGAEWTAFAPALALGRSDASLFSTSGSNGQSVDISRLERAITVGDVNKDGALDADEALELRRRLRAAGA